MVEILSLTSDLCKAAAELEKACLSTAWSESQLADIIGKENYRYVTALTEGKLSGVGGVICTEDSAEIFTVAVSAEHRKKGIGGKILSELIAFCKRIGTKSIFLEVEEGNESAIALYSKFGFLQVGLRKGFYHGKNAIIMELELNH
jgi:ribosomal-protein-alanine N-acetyltransferase